MTISDTRQFLYYSYDPSQHHPAFDWTPPFSRSNGVLVDFVDFVEKVELNRNGSHSYYHVRWYAGGSNIPNLHLKYLVVFCRHCTSIFTLMNFAEKLSVEILKMSPDCRQVLSYRLLCFLTLC